MAALRLGTKDARFLYHAGFLARDAGNPARARERLDEALRLSPELDPVHAREARQVRTELRLEAAG